MEIMITEVTEMGQFGFCIAGWQPAAQRMVRPIPTRPVWLDHQLKQSRIQPGTLIRFTAATPACNGDDPHRTEGVRVGPNAAWLMDAGPASWFGQGAVPYASTFSTAFEGELRHDKDFRSRFSGCCVLAGVQSRSLWAVRVRRADLSFLQDSYGKLRVRAGDGSRRYELPVSAHVLKELWRTDGIDAVNGSLPEQGDLHVRVGLARAYAASPEKCYVMVNGVHW